MTKKTTAPPPAYFLSLSLENVRSFGEKQTIYFLAGEGEIAQWTIILGDNGVGKSTLLKSLVAVSPVQEESQPVFYVPMYIENWKYKWMIIRNAGENPSVIKSEIGVGKYFVNNSGAKEYKIKWQQKLEVTWNDANLLKAKRSGTVLGDEVAEAKCYSYGAGRVTGNSTLGETQDVSDTSISLFDDQANLLNPEEWFLQADYRIKSDNDELTRQNFKLLRQALIAVLEGVEDLRVSPVAPSGNPYQGLQFKTPYGWVRLRDMSLGYQTLVVWLTDFASKLFIRYPDSPNPLEEPAIVLIDEIDLHLHPSWQRKLIGFLSGIFKNTQFIATAHSPLVVQAAGDQPGGANVVLLRREGDQTIVHQNPEDVRGWRLDQIMTSELFGLETARSLATEAKLAERAALLSKTRRTAAEKQRLQALTAELDQQPLGETPSERDVNAVLQQLREKLGHNPSDAPAA